MTLRVLITASARGIGYAIAQAFRARGDQVHLCDLDPAALTDACRQLDCGGSLCDVAEADQVDALFADIERQLGGLDVLVNNAGIAGPTAPIENIEPHDWRNTLAVCLDSAYLCARRAVPLLKTAGGGAIVNIASTAGQFGYPLRSPYVAAKWGMIGLTKTLAMELGEYGIRANVVCPGSVAGPRMDRVIALQAVAESRDPEAIRTGYAKQVSLRTFVSAKDIANTVVFLCSPAGDKISGLALPVDGHTETLRTD